MTSSLCIESYLAGDDNFLGCFPKDKLPTFPSQFPKCLIVNTHVSSKPGEHWVALVLFENKCFYFDSFGLPIVDLSILKYLKRYKKVSYSNTCIQDVNSNQCGQFCIAFIQNVRSKKSYSEFVNLFDSVNLKLNDVIVNYILK